jgi:hypothetical protein
MQVTDPNVVTTTLTQYNQLFPKTRTPSMSLVTRSSNGAWMHQTLLTYTPPDGSVVSIPVVFNTAHVQTNFYTFAPSSSTPDTTHA